MKVPHILILAFCFLLLNESCSFSKGKPPSFCSFDNGFCGFVNDQSGTDDFDWIRLKHAGETVTRFRITRYLIRHISRPIGGFHIPGFPFYGRPVWETKKVPYLVNIRGPTRDTTGKGFFLYSKPRQESAKAENLARLVSPVYTNVSCVKFYYFMYGSGIGGLEVLVKTGNFTPSKVWSLFGNVANAWKLATIPLKSNSKQPVQVDIR
ncbi:MAM and LDL-receptor class A domain-containing protein 2-like [Actinia tenebrosa]|uniref:MAM and LDL-receptor class A domain-containing protein 2-like n=1 Tax=Actinia tenebrosa TaxID=6105 RepID=A0A6P8IMD0_ACTTE|nr:MAM and LDL-receptor class A domain-containing protein 2-like [Actinia tenebrosa]